MDLLSTYKKASTQQGSGFQSFSPQRIRKTQQYYQTRTPSRMNQFLINRQVSNQKKLQEESSKLRHLQTQYKILQDKIVQLQQEKTGLQQSFTTQITLYKQISEDREKKSDTRIKEIQQRYDKRIEDLVNQNEREILFAQQQNQLLQAKIAELERIIRDLQSKLSNSRGDYQGIVKENNDLKVIQQNLTKKLQQAGIAYQKLEQEHKRQLEQFRRKLQDTVQQWERRVGKEVEARQREIQKINLLHRNQLDNAQNRRIQESMLKSQQLKNLTNTFQRQTTRLNQIILKKQEQISELSKNLQAEKQRFFSMSKTYENQLTNLSHQRSRLKQENIRANTTIQRLTADNRDLQERLNAQTQVFRDESNKLKKELELNQINLVREIDTSNFTVQQLTRQVTRLRAQNDQVGPLIDQNNILNRELRNMKELLIESSTQMERCKQEFIRIVREKDLLAIKLRQLGIQNQTLYRIKNQRQQQARNWKESYFTQKVKY